MGIVRKGFHKDDVNLEENCVSSCKKDGWLGLILGINLRIDLSYTAPP